MTPTNERKYNVYAVLRDEKGTPLPIAKVNKAPVTRAYADKKVDHLLKSSERAVRAYATKA